MNLLLFVMHLLHLDLLFLNYFLKRHQMHNIQDILLGNLLKLY